MAILGGVIFSAWLLLSPHLLDGIWTLTSRLYDRLEY